MVFFFFFCQGLSPFRVLVLFTWDDLAIGRNCWSGLGEPLPGIWQLCLAGGHDLSAALACFRAKALSNV